MASTSQPRAWKVLLAFAIIYFVWGSTFLAIRVGVREMPPFLMAGMRFVMAGGILYLWMKAKGEPSPTWKQWRGATLLAVLFFVGDYGLVFWAETRVASGVTAVMMATIPVFIAITEIGILKTQRLTLRLACALLVGMAGVAVLVGRSAGLGDAAVDTRGACALLLGAVCWAVGSALTRKVELPPAKTMSSAAQMFSGGVMLTLTSAALGEFRGFHVQAVSRNAWLALAYLIVFGSIIAFTAYVWLIHHESPTKVGTYAYVNPVVAVLVGYFLGGEAIGLRTAAGTLLILVSVIVITTTPKKMPEASSITEVQELAEP